MSNNNLDNVNQMPGKSLLTDGAPSHNPIREVSVDILPVQHANHVANFADNFGAGWFDAGAKALRLQMHVVSIFRNGKTEKLLLEIPEGGKKLPLTPTRIDSPGMGNANPDIAWSGQSRFVVDEIVDFSEVQTLPTRIELMAEVEGRLEKVGSIYIGNEVISTQAQVATAQPEQNAHNTTPTKMESKSVSAISSKYPLAGSSLRDGLVDRVQNAIKQMDRLFLFTVVLPTLAAIIYFGIIASDLYISESRFVVRSPQKQSSTGLSALIQSSGFSRSQDDSYTVHDYIFSRDALQELEKQFSLSNVYSDSDIDIFSRFAGLDWDRSFEALHSYYQKRIVLELDTTSSIATLKVSAFNPEIANRMNEKLLELSEALVNKLNERGRKDLIQFATDELAAAEKRATSAALAVSNYRNKKGTFDPDKQSALQLQQISKIQDELIASKVLLAQTRQIAKNNPQISAMQQRIDTLQSEIDLEVAKVAGGNRSLAHKSFEYESLILEKNFSEKLLAAAFSSLEQARNDAQRKQLYLERIVQPSKPDVAVEPRRIRNIFATFMLGMIAWGILTMLLAGIREHQD